MESKVVLLVRLLEKLAPAESVIAKLALASTYSVGVSG